MDKTYSDLMDIVKRTKKIDGDSPARPSRTPRYKIDDVQEEPEEYLDEELEEEIEEKDDLKKSSLFAGRNAISNYLNKPKKTTAKKTTKKATTKSEPKKTTAKKTTTTKAKKAPVKKEVEKPVESIKPTTVNSAPLDMSDPKNIELYNALHGTLFAGGTDVTDYMPEEAQEFSSTASKLKELSVKKKAEQINDEITKEQQEYERLFTGSFLDEVRADEPNMEEIEEPANEEQNEDDFQKYLQMKEAENKGEEVAEQPATEEIPDEEEKAEEQVAEEPTNRKVSAEAHAKTLQSQLNALKSKQLDKDLEEIQVRNAQIDQKIADYYKRKQEQLDKYNAEQKAEDDGVVEQPKVSEYESKQQSYDEIFGGEMVSRDELLGIKHEEVEEPTTTEEVAEELEQEENEVQTTEVETEESVEEPETEDDATEEVEESIEETEDLDNIGENPVPEELTETTEEETEELEEVTETEESEEVTNDTETEELIENQPQTLEYIAEEDEAGVEDEEPVEEDDFQKYLFMKESEVNGETQETTSAESVEEMPVSEENEELANEETTEVMEGISDSVEEQEIVDAEETLGAETEVDEETEISDVNNEEIEELSEEVAMTEDEESTEKISEQDYLRSAFETDSLSENYESELEEDVVAEETTETEENQPQTLESVAENDEESIEESAETQNEEVLEEVEEQAETEEISDVEEDEFGKESFTDEELIESEMVEVDDIEDLDDADDVEDVASEQIEEDNLYNSNDDDDDDDSVFDYIVSSNMPKESTKVDTSDDDVIYMNENDLPENKFDVWGNEVINETEEPEEYEEQKAEEKPDNSVSKEEFYSEMAKLQENLINELKNNKNQPEEKVIEEKPVAPVNINVEPTTSDSSTINKALDIISHLTQKENTVTETVTPKVEPIVVTEDKTERAEKVVDELVESFENDSQIEEIVEANEEEQTAEISENTSETNENIDELAGSNVEVNLTELLGTMALNESDLEYAEETEKAPVKDDVFYMSPEDKDRKYNDEYMTVYDKGETNTKSKEVGDINLNVNIQNAIPSSEIIKEKLEETEKETNNVNNMETIYTLFGMEKKKVENKEEEIKVLYVASECQPFIATGGLGDVAGSLPKAVAGLGGVDIRVIMPLYGNIKDEYRDKFEYLGNFTVHLSWRQEYCGLFRYNSQGVTYYFIDNERYFKRNAQYGFYDDGERFAYFCKAVVESFPIINFFPDIVHCNDWQSALVSTYIKTGNWSDFRYYKIKNIYTIHNVEYQGVYGMENLKDLFGIDYRFKNDMEYNGDINLTKAAIQFSDKFTTVSDSYCDNLKQPYCSRGLHHIIIRNEYKLSGIVNGIDYDFYNPKTDTGIYKNYDVDTLQDKVANKKIWQDELGLPVDGRTPMLAIVSRLVSHKGLDLLTKVLDDVLQQDIQLVVVGKGDARFVDYFNYLEDKYPTKVRAMVDKFSVELARKAYAASDIFLMPSKIEPCGISQMIASRYGSVPIVREVGGLRDTIKDFGCEEGGNGYTFANYNPNDLRNQMNRAIQDYQNQPEWESKMKICMNVDFRWEKSAKKYIELYKSLVD